MLYAFGEILLVVIGILIALQVNNWNEQRVIRSQEINYLQNLDKDLKKDLTNLSQMQEERQQKLEASVELMGYPIPETKAEYLEFNALFNTLFFWREYNPSNNTFKELVSSGNFNIISNDSIKTYLLEMEQVNSTIIGIREHMRREYDHYLYDIVVPKVELLAFYDFERLVKERIPVKDTSKVTSTAEIDKLIEDSEFILSNKAFNNALKLIAGNNAGILKYYGQKVTQIKKTQEFIRQEIDS